MRRVNNPFLKCRKLENRQLHQQLNHLIKVLLAVLLLKFSIFITLTDTYYTICIANYAPKLSTQILHFTTFIVLYRFPQ